MRLPVFALLLALAPLSAALAAVNDEDNPAYGVWMTDGGKSKVHVYRRDGKLCSKIIWLRDPLDSDGQPYHDELNQNVSLRTREVVGINVLDGMTQTSRYEWEGQVYNPEDGKTYKAYLALIKPDVLRLKGCLPMGWPCRSKFWKKLDEEPPSAAESETVVASVEEEEIIEETGDPAAEAEPRAETPSPAAEAEPRTPREADRQQMEVATAEAPPPPAAPKVITPPQQAQPQPAQPQQAARTGDIPPPPPIPQVGQPARQASPAPQASLAPPTVASTPQASQDDRQTRQAPVASAQQPVAPPARHKAPQTRSEAAVSMPPSLPERVAPPPAPQPQAWPSYGDKRTRYSALSQPTRPATGDDGARYLVQVAARQNESEAMAVFHDLRQRYPELLGQAQPIIKRVNLGDLGVWYRVRVGPITGKSTALAFCNRLKFAGSDCFIRRQ